MNHSDTNVGCDFCAWLTDVGLEEEGLEEEMSLEDKGLEEEVPLEWPDQLMGRADGEAEAAKEAQEEQGWM